VRYDIHYIQDKHLYLGDGKHMDSADQKSKYFIETKYFSLIALHKINKLQLIEKLKFHVRNVSY